MFFWVSVANNNALELYRMYDRTVMLRNDTLYKLYKVSTFLLIKVKEIIWKKENANSRMYRKHFGAPGENRTRYPPCSSSDAPTTELLKALSRAGSKFNYNYTSHRGLRSKLTTTLSWSPSFIAFSKMSLSAEYLKRRNNRFLQLSSY